VREREREREREKSWIFMCKILLYLFYVKKIIIIIMKIAYDCFKKGHGTHEKKKIVLKNKIETSVPK
jgi:hypothetical protein